MLPTMFLNCIMYVSVVCGRSLLSCGSSALRSESALLEWFVSLPPPRPSPPPPSPVRRTGWVKQQLITCACIHVRQHYNPAYLQFQSDIHSHISRIHHIFSSTIKMNAGQWRKQWPRAEMQANSMQKNTLRLLILHRLIFILKHIVWTIEHETSKWQNTYISLLVWSNLILVYGSLIWNMGLST